MPEGAGAIVPSPLSVSHVDLAVRDLDAARRFYADVVGLEEVDNALGHAVLGVDGRPLVALYGEPTASRPAEHDPGLFHTAFLLPSESALGGWLKHALDRDFRLTGAADHGVSAALYLDDPDGNGVEIYADRPRDRWPMADGLIAMANDPLDRTALLKVAAPWRGAPPATVVGHVHLKVADLDEAETFFVDVLGLRLTARFAKARFFAAGDDHHHFATNVWRSAGRPSVADGTAGLRAIHLVADEHAMPAAGTAAPDRTTTVQAPGKIAILVHPRGA